MINYSYREEPKCHKSVLCIILESLRRERYFALSRKSKECVIQGIVGHVTKVA